MSKEKRISSIQELEYCLDEKCSIVGENWICELVKLYADQKNYTLNSNKTNVLICAQEDAVSKMVAEILQSNPDISVYYISSGLKNKLDKDLSGKYPTDYEKRVLVVRKAEIDSEKTEEFRKIIDDYVNNEHTMFESIEIETINRCNGTCEFCPINRNADTRKYAKMSDALFLDIINQLREMQYEGKLALFSNNEPLLDNRIVKFAKIVGEELPKACKILFSNGTLMTLEIFRELVAVLDVICLDIYYDEELEKEIPEEIRKVFIECLNNPEMKEKTMIQFICRKAKRNNRGGESSNRSFFYKVQAPCVLPYLQMIVRPDGKTSLCCNDAFGKYTLADLNKERLIEAWNNDNYKKIRSQISHTRQSIEMCQMCDNYASTNTKGKDFFPMSEKENIWKYIEDNFYRK